MLGPSIVLGATPFAFGFSVYAIRKPEARVISATALVLSTLLLLALIAFLILKW